MPVPTDFQRRIGTVAVTFTQTGTYSTVADMGGMDLVGVYSPAYPAAAGSLTFRASFDPSGTGFPVYSEASVLLRVNPFGSGTFYSFTPGSIPYAPYIIAQVGTAGTTAAAGGGTIILVGRAS